MSEGRGRSRYAEGDDWDSSPFDPNEDALFGEGSLLPGSRDDGKSRGLSSDLEVPVSCDPKLSITATRRFRMYFFVRFMRRSV